jgi:hypothetical protein
MRVADVSEEPERGVSLEIDAHVMVIEPRGAHAGSLLRIPSRNGQVL